VGDELYYSAKPPFGTLPDPTAQSSQGSTSLTLANADGTPAGYVLYDGYGGVLTGSAKPPLGTPPVTLTDRLFSAQPPSERVDRPALG
jgi:hypothetical protein